MLRLRLGEVDLSGALRQVEVRRPDDAVGVRPPVKGAAGGQFRGLAAEAVEMIPVSSRLKAYNFAYLALVWGVALGAIATFWAFPGWYTFVLAFLVVSSRHQALLNVEHE